MPFAYFCVPTGFDAAVVFFAAFPVCNFGGAFLTLDAADATLGAFEAAMGFFTAVVFGAAFFVGTVWPGKAVPVCAVR